MTSSPHCRSGLAALLMMIALPAAAQNYPTKPIRIIIPVQAAGAVDIVPRMLAEKMSADLGQPILLENKPGGLGMPAINDVMGSPADGHTIFAADASHWAIVPALQSVAYDFLRDFTPVSLVFTNGIIIVAGGNSGINTLKDLIAQARAKPGVLNYGTPGVGSVHHLVLASLAATTGMDVRHIPYKGAGEMAESLLRGDTQFTMISLPAVAPHAKAGKMKMLAVNMNRRMKLAPDVPTVEEAAGLTDFNYPGQQGFAVRTGTPKPIVDRIAASMRKVGTPEFANGVLEKTGAEFTLTTPEQFADLIRGDIRKYIQAVKVSGAKAN